MIELGSCIRSSPATHPSVEAVTTATRPSSFLPPAEDMDRTKEKQIQVLEVLSKDLNLIMLFPNQGLTLRTYVTSYAHFVGWAIFSILRSRDTIRSMKCVVLVWLCAAASELAFSLEFSSVTDRLNLQDVHGQIAAFADFNADKATDILVLNVNATGV